MRALTIAMSLALLAPALCAEQPDAWTPFAPLIGDWTGEGGGAPRR